MLTWLTDYLSQYISFFNVFQYITFRSAVSAATALIISICIGPTIIRLLQQNQIGAVIRTDGPETHLAKSGTPTMGGILILIAIFASTLLWGDLTNKNVLVVLFVLLGFGFVGWLDDYLKVIKKNSKGLTAGKKYTLQSIFGLGVAVYLFFTAESPASLNYIIPFVKNIAIPLGFGYIIITYLMVVGMSNSVNFTDGLDGLAILPVVLVGGALGLIGYLVGHSEFANYLQIPHIADMGEVAVLCGAIVGAGLGFLWFNAYPASVMMGDVGALSLGAALGLIGVLVRHEIVLLIMGGLFVLETLSVMAQVANFKLFGKRILRMAPLHHHFEMKGWPESHVIIRFWIFSVMFVMIGLSTLKLR